MRITFAAALSFAALLTACGEGSAFDNSFRDSYRERAIESCAGGAQRAAPAGTNIDFRQVCACAVDRHMQGKSATALMGEDDAEVTSGAQAAMQQCIAEAVGVPATGDASGGKPPA